MSDAEETGDDLDAVVQRDVPGHHPFGGPIKAQNRQCNQQMITAHEMQIHTDLLKTYFVPSSISLIFCSTGIALFQRQFAAEGIAIYSVSLTAKFPFTPSR